MCRRGASSKAAGRSCSLPTGLLNWFHLIPILKGAAAVYFIYEFTVYNHQIGRRKLFVVVIFSTSYFTYVSLSMTFPCIGYADTLRAPDGSKSHPTILSPAVSAQTVEPVPMWARDTKLACQNCRKSHTRCETDPRSSDWLVLHHLLDECHL